MQDFNAKLERQACDVFDPAVFWWDVQRLPNRVGGVLFGLTHGFKLPQPIERPLGYATLGLE